MHTHGLGLHGDILFAVNHAFRGGGERIEGLSLHDDVDVGVGIRLPPLTLDDPTRVPTARCVAGAGNRVAEGAMGILLVDDCTEEVTFNKSYHTFMEDMEYLRHGFAAPWRRSPPTSHTASCTTP